MSLKRVDVREAKRLMDDEGYALIDVRSVPEYDESHAEGSFNVPLLHKTSQGMIPNPDFVATVKNHFPDPSTPLILTCAMGGRSVRATQELLAQGYERAVDLKGGFGGEYDESGAQVNEGWVPAGLPIEHGSTEGRAYKYLEPKKAEPEPEATAERVTQLEEDLPEDAEGINRFASRRRKVDCVKLGRELPGLKRRPYPGPLGTRIFNEISASAWNDWVEHSKMIINEYRINSADPSSIKLLMEQCETFLFGGGDGVARPEGYVPEA